MIKEPEKKEQRNHIFCGLGREYVLFILLLIVAIGGGLILNYYLGQTQDSIFGNADTDTIAISEEKDSSSAGSSVSSNQSTSEPTALTADQYFADGQNQMSNQAWDEAVKSFAQAITLDPKQPSYYNRKSQAEYNLGQKDQAIKTLKDGLAQNPGDDLLSSRLDVLEKDWYGNQPQ